MTFPALPGKYRYPTAYSPAAFLDALRSGGGEPGTVPESVVFTYTHFELYLSGHPGQYTPNHLLGSGPGTFPLVNSTDGRVGVNCLGVGAPAAVAQLGDTGRARCQALRQHRRSRGVPG